MTNSFKHAVSLLIVICAIAEADDQTPQLPVLRSDDALRPKIEASIRISYILRDTRDTTLVRTRIQVDHPPADMAFDMSLRYGDETCPLGPVAWAKDEIHGWSLDTDLPEHIRTVDVVLTPSARAAVKVQYLTRRDPPNLTEIWSGAPIVLKEIKVRQQRIGMHTIAPLSKTATMEELLEHLDPADPVARQLKRDGNLTPAIAAYQRKVEKAPDDALAQYQLGCLLLANRDLMLAVNSLMEARRLDPTPQQKNEIQRQLRRVCAMWWYGAARGDLDAMCKIGQAYENGWGVNRDYQQAKRWLRNAANAGDPTAMRHLAAIYEQRLGATIHTEKAQQWYRSQTREWYQKAADLGDEKAKQWIKTQDSQ